MFGYPVVPNNAASQQFCFGFPAQQSAPFWQPPPAAGVRTPSKRGAIWCPDGKGGGVFYDPMDVDSPKPSPGVTSPGFGFRRPGKTHQPNSPESPGPCNAQRVLSLSPIRSFPLSAAFAAPQSQAPPPAPHKPRVTPRITTTPMPAATDTGGACGTIAFPQPEQTQNQAGPPALPVQPTTSRPENDDRLIHVVGLCAQVFQQTDASSWKQRHEGAEHLKQSFLQYAEHRCTPPPGTVDELVRMGPLLCQQLRDPRPPVVVAVLQAMQTMAQAVGPTLAPFAMGVLPVALGLLKKTNRAITNEADSLIQIMMMYCPDSGFVPIVAEFAKDPHAQTRSSVADYLLVMVESAATPDALPPQLRLSIFEATEALVQDAAQGARDRAKRVFVAARRRWPEAMGILLQRLEQRNPNVARALGEPAQSQGQGQGQQGPGGPMSTKARIQADKRAFGREVTNTMRQ